MTRPTFQTELLIAVLNVMCHGTYLHVVFSDVRHSEFREIYSAVIFSTNTQPEYEQVRTDCVSIRGALGIDLSGSSQGIGPAVHSS